MWSCSISYDRKQMEQTQRPKPANELTNQEIVAEARDLHFPFQISSQGNTSKLLFRNEPSSEEKWSPSSNGSVPCVRNTRVARLKR